MSLMHVHDPRPFAAGAKVPHVFVVTSLPAETLIMSDELHRGRRPAVSQEAEDASFLVLGPTVHWCRSLTDEELHVC
jgi:hypothetical protein